MLLARFDMLVFFTNLGLMEFSLRYLALFRLFFVIDGFWMGILKKNIQLMLEFIKAPFLFRRFFYYTLMAFLMMLSRNIAISADDNTLYSKCDQESDQWQQLELASELESDLRSNVDWDRKWLVDFNVGKTQFALFDRSHNTGTTDVKVDGSVIKKKSSFKMLGLVFFSKLRLLHYFYSLQNFLQKN